MNERVRAVLETILERFKSGDIPKAIAYALFPIPKIPSASWSLLNRIMMLFGGTTDARGIRQWNSVGRKVKRGAKAIYILVPRYATVKGEGDEEEARILRGFLAKPVFRVEDTKGEELVYDRASVPLPNYPLLEKAREWNITVSAIPRQSTILGAYCGQRKEIQLASRDEIIFFHELSHAAHERVIQNLRPGQHWDQEVVAQLAAQTLCFLVGKDGSDMLGNSYVYIERYAKKAGLTPIAACLRVLDDVEKVLNLILGKEVEREDDNTQESTQEKRQASHA